MERIIINQAKKLLYTGKHLFVYDLGRVLFLV